MYARASAPRSIGGVLDDAIRLYREAFSRIWPLNVIAAVAIGLPTFLIVVQSANVRKGDAAAALAMVKSPGFWLSYALMMFIYLVVQSALLSALNTYAAGREPSLESAFGVGLRRLPRMVVAGVFLFLIIMIGLVLLVIPGIYLWGIFQLSFVAIIVDDAGAFESFGVSSRLIKGNWWRAATVFTVAVIIIMVLSFVGGMVNGLLAAVLGLGSMAALASQTVVGGVLNVFMIPLMPCFLLAMYFDLKLRHEGGDLAARVNAIAPR
jgi:hypothetical protein